MRANRPRRSGSAHPRRGRTQPLSCQGPEGDGAAERGNGCDSAPAERLEEAGAVASHAHPLAPLPSAPAVRRWLRILSWAAAGVVLFTVTVRVARAAPAGGPIRLTAPLVGEKARTGESEIGNLAADALRAATGADIALVAGGELREASLPPGEVNSEQVVGLLAFGQDAVVVLSLTGATVREALKQGVAQYPRKNKGFLQVSGLQFSFTPGDPITARTADGAPLQDGKSYRVAMSSSLASGAYGYFRLWGKTPDASPAPGEGLTLARAVQDYLRKNRPLNLRIEGRIVAQGK